MAFGFSKTRFSPIAVDFGADSLKLLQIGLDEPPSWVAAAAQPLPESARHDTAERLDFLERVLKDMFKDPSFRGRRVMCSIPAFQTLVHHFELPTAAAGEDLQSQVELELRQRLNIEPTRMVMRLFKMDPVMRPNGSRQRVICLAAKRDAVMAYVELLQRCKLEVVGMHSEPLCILRAFSHLYRRQSDTQRTTCFIDIGAATTKVVIAHGADMVFAKGIDVGGDMLVRALASRSQISFAEARKAVVDGEAERSTALLDPSAGTSQGVLDALSEFDLSDRSIASPDQQMLECLVDELRLSLRYYAGLYRDREIDKLVFLGGAANNAVLCQRVAEAMNMTAMIGDPLARLIRDPDSAAHGTVQMDQPQAAWATPMGLCLSEANL